MSRVSPARRVAYDVLRDVDDRDAYANLALQSRIAQARLDRRDAALATELAAGTLRGRGRYDRIIELAADRSLSRIDARTQNVLRLGAHQILSMRTAPHAAVHESVELQRLVASARGAGFVNGVLRTIGRTSSAQWDEQLVARAENADEALAATTSHPAWIVRALRAALRADGAEVELGDLLEANNTPARVSLAVLRAAELTAAQVASELAAHGAQATGPSPLGVEIDGGEPARVIAALAAPEASVRVQDQGSQIAALMLTHATPIASGESWLDLCSGPGGKTAILGDEAVRARARVRANEISPHRARLVRDAVRAVSSVVEVVEHDGVEDVAFGGADAEFDRILVDAPCTGLGALRRRPEARWRKQPGDLPELTRLQERLIDAAVRHLAPGGVLAYVTCSPHLAETRVAVDAALQRHPELAELDARDVFARVARVEGVAGDDAMASEGAAATDGRPSKHLSVQLWPHRHGTDAMFIALLTRQ